MGPEGVRIAAGREEDVPIILRLIKGLAEYEKLSHDVVATEDDIRTSLFGQARTAEVVLAFSGDTAIGFALFFTNFSTFLGRPGLYLEDLFVLPEWRNRSVGRQLLAHLAALATERRYGRMEWAVLDWNTSAIAFYERLGAQVHPDWRICRLTGDALTRVASSGFGRTTDRS